MRCPIVRTLCISLLAGSTAALAASEPIQSAPRSKPSRGAARTVSRAAVLTAALRARVADAVPVKAVRFAPDTEALRITSAVDIVKEPIYREVLAIACDEIEKARSSVRVRMIEVVNAPERQGYVYRGVSKCDEVVRAGPERRRLLLIPDTRIFRPRR
jgi:hypothetical protein